MKFCIVGEKPSFPTIDSTIAFLLEGSTVGSASTDVSSSLPRTMSSNEINSSSIFSTVFSSSAMRWSAFA